MRKTKTIKQEFGWNKLTLALLREFVEETQDMDDNVVVAVVQPSSGSGYGGDNYNSPGHLSVTGELT